MTEKMRVKDTKITPNLEKGTDNENNKKKEQQKRGKDKKQMKQKL